MTELCNALVRAGCEVNIVGPALSAASVLGETDGLIKRLKDLVPKPLYELLEFAYTLVAFLRLFRACYKFKPDAIYERYNLHLHAARFVARMFKIPFLLEVNAPLAWERSTYGGLALKRFAHWSEGSSWRAADYVLPVTDVLADHLRNAGVQHSKIVVIPNGANLDQYPFPYDREKAKERLGLSGQTILGFVGFVRDWHGLSALIEWMASAKQQSVTLLLVGDGPDRLNLEQLSERLGIRDRLVVTGFVPRDQVPNYIRSFDIALQPAVTPYASPLKLFEYLAAGCAVVSVGSRNMREILSHEKTALLSDETNKLDFGLQVIKLLESTALRQSLGAEARALVESAPYTWDGNAQTVLQLIKKTKQQ
jgi:glycosyltransferase involved in cell wall biosynthesis